MTINYKRLLLISFIFLILGRGSIFDADTMIFGLYILFIRSFFIELLIGFFARKKIEFYKKIKNKKSVFSRNLIANILNIVIIRILNIIIVIPGLLLIFSTFDLSNQYLKDYNKFLLIISPFLIFSALVYSFISWKIGEFAGQRILKLKTIKNNIKEITFYNYFVRGLVISFLIPEVLLVLDILCLTGSKGYKSFYDSIFGTEVEATTKYPTEQGIPQQKQQPTL